MEGRLLPYARPRLSQNGGNIYSPTAQFKRDVQLLMSAQACRNKWVCLPTSVPVRVKIVYSVATCHLRRGSHPAGDVDNLAKTVLDALTGIVYSDDRQVRELRVFKDYGSKTRWIVYVETLEEDEDGEEAR